MKGLRARGLCPCAPRRSPYRAAADQSGHGVARTPPGPSVNRPALPLLSLRLVVSGRLSLRGSDVDEPSRARALRIGEIEPRIDRQRALPDLPPRHAAIPAAPDVTERDKRVLIKLRQLCARRDGRVGSAAPYICRARRRARRVRIVVTLKGAISAALDRWLRRLGHQVSEARSNRPSPDHRHFPSRWHRRLGMTAPETS